MKRLACLAAAALALGWAPAAQAQPPIWTVHAGATTLTLFGSIHLLPAGLDWRPAALDQALADADEIWFELPIDANANNEAAAASLERGGLPKDRRLNAMLDADQRLELAQATAQLSAYPDAIDRMQPWMAELTLSVAEDARSGADASNGVEAQIQAITGPKVKRRAFETPRQQIEFLAGTPVKDQVASLDFTLHEINDDPASYQRVVDDWMAGDVAHLAHDSLDPLRSVSTTLYDRLIGQRNRRWAHTLEARLKKPGHIVVVVGVGHLIGPDSVPALLRAQGYDVEGP